MVQVSFFGSSIAHLLHEPGIEVHREVRALLLGASRGNDGQAALSALCRISSYVRSPYFMDGLLL